MTFKELLTHAIDVAEFNTNNAWGFGGGYGKKYSFKNGIVIKVGTACYRHAPNSKFITVYQDDKLISDQSKEPLPVHIAILYSLIK